jgi:NAD(P)-dependent dehydrogenase (short-subunit alcohol dehydrogenase family)
MTVMKLDMQDKTALVSGSSRGIGAAIARTLAAEGVRVGVTGRDSDRTAIVVNEITRAGGQAVAVHGDLSHEPGAFAVATAAMKELGPIDILVNNAGGTDSGFFDWNTAKPEDWALILNQNFLSAIYLSRHLKESMRKRGWGRIVNITTAWASQPDSSQAHYSAAKAALANATVSLAREMAGSGVTANSVAPGPILTPLLERFMRDLAQQNGWGDNWLEIERRFIETTVPLSVKRIGRTEDVANIVAYLASPLADFITGATIRVDGGFNRSVN